MNLDNNEDLVSLISTAPMGICLLHSATLITEMVNNTFLKVAGKHHENVYGKYFWDSFAEVAPYYEDTLANVIKEGKPFYGQDTALTLVRYGRRESVLVTFVFMPLKDKKEQVEKVAIWLIENTGKIRESYFTQNLNEELAAINEELTASNEELLSTQHKLFNLNSRLAASESRFRSLIEQIPTAINVFKSRELIIELPNDQMLEIWGRTARQVIDKPLLIAMPELAGQPFLKRLDEVLTTGKAYHSGDEKAFIKRNGKLEECYFNIVYQPIINEDGSVTSILQICTEVTREIAATRRILNLNEELTAINEELISTNRELQQSQQDYITVYNELLKNQQDLLFTIDAAGLGTFDFNPVNGKFASNHLLKSWFGLPPDAEIHLEEALNVIAVYDRQRVVSTIEEALQFHSGGKYDTEYDIIADPGNPVPRTIKAKGKTLFNDQQEAIRLSGTLQDVTEQKKDEQRKNDFIGMVSHEMKTPLTSLNGYIQLLQKKTAQAEDSFMVSALDKAKKQLDKMTTMINGFLNISRLESSKLQIDKQLFDLAELVKETELETMAATTSHRFLFEPVMFNLVEADRDKIGHVINNLISNAIKYSPRDSTIQIACITKSSCAEISVKDEGVGIAQNDVDKIFDRYYRVDNEHMKTIGGFGIGLYLCKEIIQHHDGKIWVESEPGKGSTFYFNLPVHQ